MPPHPTRQVAIRVPAAFAKSEIGTYEAEAIGALVEWLQSHPGGLFIDVGSEIGIFSGTAMFFDKAAEVIAFDADIKSVAAISKFCRYAPRPDRLTAIHGLITDDAPMTSMAEAEPVEPATQSGHRPAQLRPSQ